MDALSSHIAAAANIRSLYPANHPLVVQSVTQVLASHRNAVEQGHEDAITYLLVGDDLVFRDEVIRNTTFGGHEFIALLKRQGIERLTLAGGLTLEEVHEFIGTLVSGESPRSTDHIIVGRAKLVMEDKPQDAPPRELTVQRLEVAREAWARFRADRRLPIEHVEELVWSFIDSLARNTRSILPLSPLKEHDEYTFVHSVNVSLLVLAQARSFGISGPTLHEFGMAGLLHDVGKLSIPIEVLNKPGKLNSDEWEVMKSHASQGAWYLSAIEGAAPLSVVVAFEHHLRFDTRPNYPVLRTPRVPTLASRMTAIADAYDAMLTKRPYDQPLGRSAAIEVLRTRAGTFYDPLLVGNFIQLIGSAASEGVHLEPPS